MTSEPFQVWANTMKALLAELATQQPPYPYGTNELFAPSASAVVPLEALRPLYAVCGGMCLEDVFNAYFIDRPDHLLPADDPRLPNRIGGEPSIAIQVFGADGGGGKYAIGKDDDEVYYLHAEGAVEDGAYLESDAFPVRTFDGGLPGFLQRLLADVEAFVHERPGHVYIEFEDRFRNR
jgi:hypothetical protein